MSFNTDTGTNLGFYLGNSPDPAATILNLSPSTPPLTTSPTVASSATASPTFSPYTDFPSPTNGWFGSCLDTQRTSIDSLDSVSAVPPSVSIVDELLAEFYPDISLLRPASTGDAPRPRKKARLSPKLDHAHGRSFPRVVAIPPASAADVPPALAKKPARKPAAPPSAKAARRKRSPGRKGPVRFCFVSVAHDTQSVGNSTVELTERMEEDSDAESFEHGPSELPPRPYPGGQCAVSPLRPPQKKEKIPASILEFLPILEARFTRLERAIQHYVDFCSNQALHNSILPESHGCTA